MQRLEVSGAVRPTYGSLGVKRLRHLSHRCLFRHDSRPCPVLPAIVTTTVSPLTIVFEFVTAKILLRRCTVLLITLP